MGKKLRKVSITVLKDKTGTDTARIPADGVDVTFHKRGVITDRGQVLAVGSRTLYLRDAAPLKVNDVLQKTTDATSLATVTAILGGASVTVTVSGGTLTLLANDRLVLVGPAGRVPTIYADPLGVTSVSTLATDSDGYAQAYLMERQADILLGMVTGGILPRFREAETAGDDEVWVNAANYATIQDAVDAVPTTLGNRGGTVYIPPGEYPITATLVLNKSVRLVGDGVTSTVLFWTDATRNVDAIRIESPECVIEHLGIGYNGATPLAGTGRGIVVGAGPSAVGGTVIRDVYIFDCPSWGIALQRYVGVQNYISHSLFERINIFRPLSGGCFDLGGWSYVTKIVACNFDASAGAAGVRSLAGSNVNNLDVDTCELASRSGTVGVYLDVDITLADSPGNASIRIANCDIETVGGTSAFMVHLKNVNGLLYVNNRHYIADYGVHLEDCNTPTLVGNEYTSITNEDIKLTDCVKAALINEHAVDTSGATVTLVWTEAGTCVGTFALVNGVVHVPRYTTGNLPAAAASSVIVGGLAYDTTKDNLVVLNNAGAWVEVGLQT